MSDREHTTGRGSTGEQRERRQPKQEDRCECGHEAVWHGDEGNLRGVGACEYPYDNSGCSCQRFGATEDALAREHRELNAEAAYEASEGKYGRPGPVR